MEQVQSRHTLCADKLGHIIQGMCDVHIELQETDTPKAVIDRLEGQIECLRLQEQEMLAIWEDILKVMKGEAPDGQGMSLTSSRAIVQ